MNKPRSVADIDPFTRGVVFSQLEKRFRESDFLRNTYGDKEAMQALGKILEITDQILDEGVQIEGIDSDLIRIAVETGSDDKNLMRKALDENHKLYVMEGKEQGVSYQRISKARDVVLASLFGPDEPEEDEWRKI